MKTRTRIDVLLVVLASLSFMIGTGFAQSSGKVDINADNVVIHPGVKLSKPDARALDGVLEQYDKSLYKVEVYNKGQTSSTSGTLLDMCVDQRTVAELTQAKAAGQSERAIQMIAPGSAVNPNQSTQGSPSPGVSVNPQTVPVNPTMAPVNPTKLPDGTMPAGPQMQTTPSPAGPQAAVNPNSGVNAQVVVNPNSGHSTSCAPTDPKAAEFLEKVKPILQKYSR